ncbi:rod shape-determining protein MreC [Oscillatoria amoena NRMC-F 0135]|nr:rod shape-determining protein MreC [Oscillatoria amoena NRMC-F 0135]
MIPWSGFFLFIYQYRAFFTFLVLELFAVWMFLENNQFQGTRFFNSSNRVAAAINGFSQNTADYFSLRQVNKDLAEENARLRYELEKRNRQLGYAVTVPVDSLIIKQFEFVSAKVVNNSVGRFTNFITINKGSKEGIEPGMAVISQVGVVGKVKVTSPNYSVVTSLLNVDVMVSGVLKRTGHFGTIQWDGADPDYIHLKYIPRHVQPVVGDSVITSGYSGVFPEGIFIGTIADIQLGKEAPFYLLKVKLAQDFRSLSWVTVIRNRLVNELDSLELHIPNFQ